MHSYRQENAIYKKIYYNYASKLTFRDKCYFRPANVIAQSSKLWLCYVFANAFFCFYSIFIRIYFLQDGNL